MEDICLHFVQSLQLLPTFALFFIEFLLCALILFICLKYFGSCGLYAFSACGVILANIQVLRTAVYFFQSTPVALGNTVFSVVVLANNVLVEYYGIETAKKNVYTTFIIYIFFAIMMLIALGYTPTNDKFYFATKEIFINLPKFFLSGLSAYFISQIFDVYFFKFLSKISALKNIVWLRNFIAVIASLFLDNVIFSLLAWRLLSANPLDWQTIIFGYMIGTFYIRIGAAILSSLFFIFIKALIPKGRWLKAASYQLPTLPCSFDNMTGFLKPNFKEIK